jgi:hypothetical protein
MEKQFTVFSSITGVSLLAVAVAVVKNHQPTKNIIKNRLYLHYFIFRKKEKGRNSENAATCNKKHTNKKRLIS